MGKVSLTILLISVSALAVVHAKNCRSNGRYFPSGKFVFFSNCKELSKCVNGIWQLKRRRYSTLCPKNSYCDTRKFSCFCNAGATAGYKTMYGARFLSSCTVPTTIAPTTQPLTTAAPTQPPTTAAPTQPPTTAAPTQPPSTAAPTQTPTTAAPAQPPTTAAPTQPPATAAPTQTPATAAPTQPPTTAAPTQPITTPRTHFSTPRSASCSSTWTSVGGSMCVKAFPQERKTWADARAFCKSNHGHLVITENAVTSKAIAGLLTNPLRYWIGVHDPSRNGSWQYVNGQNVTTYKPWAYKEPNNHGGNEFCVEMKSNRRGTWNDKRCSKKRPFICQKELNA